MPFPGDGTRSVPATYPETTAGRGNFCFRDPCCKDLRRIATDGVAGRMAESGVLLHEPFGDSGHPGKVGPSVGINLPKVVRVVPFAAHASARRASIYIGHSSTLVQPNRPAAHRKIACQTHENRAHTLSFKFQAISPSCRNRSKAKMPVSCPSLKAMEYA